LTRAKARDLFKLLFGTAEAVPFLFYRHSRSEVGGTVEAVHVLFFLELLIDSGIPPMRDETAHG
jgi:hypothetical protein